MSRRIIGWLIWLGLAACLYFFENNTGTRIVLACSLLLPLIPAFRRMILGADHAETPARQPVRTETRSAPEEAEDGGVRSYQLGDPVNRVHWKLSAKRMELLIRKTAPETLPEETEMEIPVSSEDKRKGQTRKRLILICLAVLMILLLCLFTIPVASRGAQALCNRLFETSERVNAYVYDRFSVPADQPVTLAAVILVFILSLMLGITILSGSRLIALGMMAACAAFQMYFGLTLPGWLNVGLFAALALWMLRRPWKGRDALTLLSAILAVSLAVLFLVPGVDAATEAASERVRDALSQVAQRITGTVGEASAGENEARHTHPLALIRGEEEARAEQEYRLETVEEAQVSMPRWVGYLKILLLLAAVLALLTVPFLPFLWLNARRKQAAEIRAAFGSANVSEAVCAMFRQVIAWLEAMGFGAGNLPYRDWARSLPQLMEPGYEQRFSQCAALFEEAAYSDHVLSEEQRGQAISLLQETEQALLAGADWKQKLRLKFGECVWTEKA